MWKVMERNFLLKVSRLRLHMIKAKVASYKRMLNIKKHFNIFSSSLFSRKWFPIGDLLKGNKRIHEWISWYPCVVHRCTQRAEVGVVCLPLSFFISSLSLLFELESLSWISHPQLGWLGSKPQGLFCLRVPVLGWQACVSMASFHVVVGDLNSHPPAFVTSTVLDGSSP